MKNANFKNINKGDKLGNKFTDRIYLVLEVCVDAEIYIQVKNLVSGKIFNIYSLNNYEILK